jgi:hypothetical protein
MFPYHALKKVTFSIINRVSNKKQNFADVSGSDQSMLVKNNNM